MMYFQRLVLVFFSSGAVLAQQTMYGQCGGIGWTGATTCVAGAACSSINAYYYQCLPATSTGSSTAATTSSMLTTSAATTTTARTSSSTTSSAPASSSTVAGTGAWTAAYSKANAALAKLTNLEKASIATGLGWQKGPCVGNVAAVSSINFPSLCLQDSPLGVRFVTQNTAWPAGVQAAATWDKDLIFQRGAGLGAEAKALGVHVLLGPVAGPLGKIPQGGRGWEGFSVDPYLTGIAMQETITGMQSSGVQACAKHYIGNEQEQRRDQMSSNIPDRVMHELYLWPFDDSVQANVASIMCSYNKLNQTYACESNTALNGLLKKELGFQGYVVSDWAAQHTTTGSANSGMDMAMPGDNFGDNNYLWGQNLVNAVSSGTVPQSRLDDIARRILAGWYLLGQDSGYPAVQFNSWGGNGGPNVQGNHATIARAVARDGTVLLKNTNNTLPFNKVASLAIIGQDAIVNPAGANACDDRACNTGTLAMGWGSGTTQFPYLIDPLSAIRNRSSSQGTTIVTSTTDDITSGVNAARSAATAVVFITSDSGEGYLTVEGNPGDRNNLDAWHSGNELVQAVAAVNKNTIVVIHSVGPLILEPFINLANVTAVVWAGIPGEESGNALADVLYGSVSPSGKLPYTIAKQTSDYGVSIKSGDDNFEEGLFIDYRRFDKNVIEPRFEFGFGLGYTTFTYSSLTISPATGPIPSLITSADRSTLYKPAVTVSATITNNGRAAGSSFSASLPAAEAAQLYVTLPSSASGATPPQQLRGFDKISLATGGSGRVEFTLRWKDLASWDGAAQGWRVERGTVGIGVGASSRKVALKGTLTV